MAYDFSTLDSHDFELLTRDLLNAKFGLDLHSFKIGKDKGIDLRVSSIENINEIVVQAKHYLKSGFKALYRVMEQEEIEKIRALNPGRYLLVTSIELSGTEKEELFSLLSPYVKTTNDIFGRDDLNKYLAELPDIETRWYKLWLTSIPVLNRVVNNGIFGMNEFVASKIRKTTQLYVPCPSYDVAFEILKKHKYLLITGQPGVGKTTLAYYLTYNLLANDFQLLYVDTDISQATIPFSDDPNTKQIIFFDDFLGETYLEINRPKTTESAFVTFLERIVASENKYLILTTRTTIYNNAIDKYEKLERMKVSVARREIVLDQYSILDKAKILFKHIYFADISIEYKEEVFFNKQYWDIIVHPNYNPRLIEFITSKKHLPDKMPTGYFQFVMNNLRNPKEVWKYFYREQISAEERLLLHVIFAQSYAAKTADTKLMFSYRLEYEIRNFNYHPDLSPFQNALKRLLDGTLKKETGPYTDRITFINPSLTDFLKHYFLQTDEERFKLLKGSCTIEQLEHYKQTFLTFEYPAGGQLRDEMSMFANFLIDNADTLQTYAELKREKNRNHYIKVRLAAILNGLSSLNDITHERVNEFVYTAIKNYPVDGLNSESRDHFSKALRYASWNSDLYSYVETNWSAIINGLFQACIKEDDFEETKGLFDEYNQEYSTFVMERENAELLADCLRELADNRTSDWIREEQPNILSDSDWRKMKSNVSKQRLSIFEAFDLEDEWYEEQSFFADLDMDNLIETNTARKKLNQNNQLTNTQKISITKDEDLVKEVELLFCGEVDDEFVRMKADDLSLPF